MKRSESYATIFALVAIVAFAPTLFVLYSVQPVQDAPYCKAEAYDADGPKDLRAGSRNQDQTANQNDEGSDSYVGSKQPALSLICQQPGAGGGGGVLTWLIAAVAASLAAAAALLARQTATEERPTKRGRLIAVFPDAGRPVVRIVNVGESAAWLKAAGWSFNPGFGLKQRPRSIFLLLPKGGGEPAEFKLSAYPIGGGNGFSILLRYSDAYGDEWHAWQGFRVTSDHSVVLEKNGEYPSGSRGDWPKHWRFPLLIVSLMFL
jgi:hypothetical protein